MRRASTTTAPRRGRRAAGPSPLAFATAGRPLSLITCASECTIADRPSTPTTVRLTLPFSHPRPKTEAPPPSADPPGRRAPRRVAAARLCPSTGSLLRRRRRRAEQPQPAPPHSGVGIGTSTPPFPGPRGHCRGRLPHRVGGSRRHRRATGSPRPRRRRAASLEGPVRLLRRGQTRPGPNRRCHVRSGTIQPGKTRESIDDAAATCLISHGPRDGSCPRHRRL